jgi:YD repeat-containing protein
VGATEIGSECGTAGTGDGVDDDSVGAKDDGCPSAVYAYDALNRLTSETDSLGRETAYQYDAASSLTQRTDARDLVTKYFYDDDRQQRRRNNELQLRRLRRHPRPDRRR